jgi:REP element-mobilizing transposase RayT
MAWRALLPMSESLRNGVREKLEQLARSYACKLHFLEVSEELVHLVITCPDGRTSLWLAERFKQGSEETLREGTGTAMQSWGHGYYARQATTPLPDDELQHFLEQNKAETE